ESEKNVGPEHSRKIAGRLDAGCRVQVSADRLNCLRDLPGVSALGSLERHMFEQMRDPVFVRLLVAAARTDPDAEGGGFKMRHSVGHHRKARRKTGHFDAHAAAPSREARDTDVTYRSTAA